MTIIDSFDPASPVALTDPFEYYRWLREYVPHVLLRGV